MSEVLVLQALSKPQTTSYTYCVKSFTTFVSVALAVAGQYPEQAPPCVFIFTNNHTTKKQITKSLTHAQQLK